MNICETNTDDDGTLSKKRKNQYSCAVSLNSFVNLYICCTSVVISSTRCNTELKYAPIRSKISKICLLEKYKFELNNIINVLGIFNFVVIPSIHGTYGLFVWASPKGANTIG